MAEVDCPDKTDFAILLVEDSDDIRAVLAKALDTLGFHSVRAAADGAKAIGFIRDEHFDLVVTDFMMPGATGDEVVRAARQANPEVDVLVMSGSFTADMESDIALFGGAAFMSKPFRLKEFCERVEESFRLFGTLVREKYDARGHETYRPFQR